jgi:hypothetical protein
MYYLLGVNDLYFFYTMEMNDDEDYKIKITSDSKLQKKTIRDLVLDVFDMDLTEFNQRLQSYEFMNDILNPDSPKPYLVQDRLEDIILL